MPALEGTIALLSANYPPRGADEGEALIAAWWNELQDYKWVDDALLALAAQETLKTYRWMPPLRDFIGVLDYCQGQREIEREAATQKALPPPTSASDDASITPEERERWAKEDAFIRSYMPRVLKEWEQSAYLDDWGPHPTKPGVEIRTAPHEMEHLREIRQRDYELAKVPDLTPQQRRARDRRIEQAKADARAYLDNKLGRGQGDRLLERLQRPMSPGERRTHHVEWADGKESDVTLQAPFRRSIEERQNRK